MIKKILTLIQKCIPAYIEVRSLYWVNYEKQLDIELSDIFKLIDEDKYAEAKVLKEIFDKKHNHKLYPSWIELKLSESVRAGSMISFLECPLED
jgi:hypothetical protein